MAGTDLSGHSVVAIVTNYGVEQDELVVPVEHLRQSGARIDIAAVSNDPIQTLIGDKDPGATVQPTMTLAEVDPGRYDMVLVPGGALNADRLRLNDDAVKIVRTFASSSRPVASICHGPWALVEAGAVNGKTLTSYPSLQTDIRNAGGNWINEAVVTDDAKGYELITSRDPGDLDAFLGAIDKTLTAA
jgi:protease I